MAVGARDEIDQLLVKKYAKEQDWQEYNADIRNIKDNQIIDVGKSGDAGDKEIFWERNIEDIFSNYYLYQDTHNEKNTNEKFDFITIFEQYSPIKKRKTPHLY